MQLQLYADSRDFNPDRSSIEFNFNTLNQRSTRFFQFYSIFEVILAVLKSSVERVEMFFRQTFYDNWLGKLKVASLLLTCVEVSWTLVASELLELWGFIAMASLSFHLKSSFWYIFLYNFVKTKSGGRRLYPILCWHFVPKALLYKL